MTRSRAEPMSSRQKCTSSLDATLSDPRDHVSVAVTRQRSKNLVGGVPRICTPIGQPAPRLSRYQHAQLQG